MCIHTNAHIRVRVWSAPGPYRPTPKSARSGNVHKRELKTTSVCTGRGCGGGAAIPRDATKVLSLTQREYERTPTHTCMHVHDREREREREREVDMASDETGKKRVSVIAFFSFFFFLSDVCVCSVAE